jgi:hypothetical protein
MAFSILVHTLLSMTDHALCYIVTTSIPEEMVINRLQTGFTYARKWNVVHSAPTYLLLCTIDNGKATGKTEQNANNQHPEETTCMCVFV